MKEEDKQAEALEQAIAAIRERKTVMQQTIATFRLELTELGKIEYLLTQQLPYDKRMDQLFS